MSSRLSDGLFIAIDTNGEICCGANRSGPKLYVYESVTIKKSKGGKVFKVTETKIEQVWPRFEAKTFFLNERHELPSVPRKKYADGDGCSACGSSSCYGHLCYGID